MATIPRDLPIIHLSAEYWPYIRTGGLGEAVRGIAAHQAALGFETLALLPLYAPIRESGCDLAPVGDPFQVSVGPRTETARLWESPRCADGVKVLLVENDEYFGRQGVYGEAGGDYPDNHRRFAFFAAAVLEVLPSLVTTPAILHMHDWHTALPAVYMRIQKRYEAFAHRIATVLTVHNGGFQGHFPPGFLPEIGIPLELYHMDYLEWYGRANILKAGLKSSDMVTTVSPSHAFELTTKDGGFGLHHTFLELGNRLVGVINGIDYRIWNPETDPDVHARYSAGDLTGKAACKEALQREHGLEVDSDRLLVGMVARLVAQKGLDLIVNGRALSESKAQFIFLGSGEPRFEGALKELAAAHPSRISVKLTFSEEAEHQIIAGADALLMPSLYEPCGLTQMRAQRYGTLPLARRVGGLEETIEDGTTGLLFDAFEARDLDALLRRAEELYSDPGAWQALMTQAMARDFSWENVVDKYEEVYERAFRIRGAAQAAPNNPA